MAQLLPLGLGVALRYASGPIAARLEPTLSRVGMALLVALAILAMIDVWQGTVNAGMRVVAAIVLTTAAAFGVGHLLGGPEAATRTAVAITSAARNPGLALLVAQFNSAPDEIKATVLGYLVISVLAIVPYDAWRHRPGR